MAGWQGSTWQHTSPWTITGRVVFGQLADDDLDSDGAHSAGAYTLTTVGAANATSIDMVNGTGLVLVHNGGGAGSEARVQFSAQALFGASAALARRRVALRLTMASDASNQRAFLRYATSGGAETVSLSAFLRQDAASVAVVVNRNGSGAASATPGTVPQWLVIDLTAPYARAGYAGVGADPDTDTILGVCTTEDLAFSGSPAYASGTDVIAIGAKDFSANNYTITFHELICMAVL